MYNMSEMGCIMKLIIEAHDKKNLMLEEVDGVILPLEDYSVESHFYYSLEEIEELCKKSSCEIFVKMNKNFLNEDIPKLEEVLKKIDEFGINGIFFYDLAILELKKELKLKTPLIWNQTHMVNNYKTCNYYFEQGVSYALLGKEITLEEILSILSQSKIGCMVEVVSKPSVAFSKRKLVTNYFKNIKEEKKNSLMVKEKVSDSDYLFVENSNGTSIFLDKVMNGTDIISILNENHCPYIIMRGYGIDSFHELVLDTMKYIHDGCRDLEYVNKWKCLGDYTNFFFKKTIYKVKKNG